VAGGAVALGAGASSVLAGCSSNSGTAGTTSAPGSKPGIGTGAPKHGGTLTVGIAAEIDGFYPPANHWDTNGFYYANAVYDPLMWTAADGTIKPYLAKSLVGNSTFDTWTMTLRSGIQFNDGSALTSAVVKANFDVLKASPLTGTALALVASVDTPDAMTVVYHLTEPSPGFPAAFTTQVGYVFGEAMIQQATSGASGTNKPVGTGPFIYADWQPNDHFIATRNPHYWRSGYPYLDQITFKPIPDTTQRESTLRSGGVDLILSTDPNSIDHFRSQSSYQVVDNLTSKVVGQSSMGFIMLNTAVAPTNDLRIRQALAKATNQAEIQKLYGGGFTQPVNGLFLPDSPYYSQTGFPTFDLAGAKSLVNAYKAQHGTPSLQLITIPDPRYENLVQILQQMWNQAGFNTTVGTVQQADIISDFVTGKFQAATSYQFGAVEPGLNYVWWSTTTLSPIGGIGLNFPRNNDPQIQTALETGRTTTDQATRVAAYQKVNSLLAHDLPYIWLSQYVFAAVANSRVQNFNNLVLPDQSAGYSFDEGIIFLTQTWLAG
jgi:peptide/nickel transport system substrate-binding protein